MAGIPQVITEDRASGAQVVEGSLKFDLGNYNRLQRTQVGGNRKTFTWSGWIKNTDTFVNTSDSHDWFSANEGNTTGGVDYGFGVRFPYNKAHSTHPHQLMVFEYENSAFKLRLISEQTFLDLSQFYHLVIAVDTTIASPSSDRVKVYVNGERITAWKSGYEQYPTQNLELTVNESGKTSHIGCSFSDGSSVVQPADGFASNFYLIDGQQLGPEEFGFTDPLTNTWRPKKFNQLSPNNGSTWSSYLTSSTSNFYTGAQGVEKAFDGDTSTYVQQVGGVNPNYITFTPPSGIAHTSTVEVWINNAQNEVSYNGGSLQSISSGWNTIATGSGTLTSIRVERPSTSGAAFGAIRIDGVILIDGDTSNMGTNGFYLPMDGNTPIGKDQSGRGNDFTPKRFGGSVDLPKATGALPILNTNDAGTVAKFGVRTDKKTYTVTASGGNYYLDGALKPTLNAYRGGTYTFDYTGATSHPFYLSSLPDGKHNSKAYSVSFDGTGDALRVADHADLRFGTGAFTIECYVWFNSFDDNYPSILSKYTGGTASWIMRVRNNGSAIYYSAVGGGSNEESPEGIISLNRWHHIAMVREGTGSNQAKMYVDGRLVVTATDNTDYTDTQEVTIGAQNASNSNVLNGYMSNVRIIKGTALYTSNFTPPGTTLTNVTGTTLLCCQDSAATTAAVIPSGSITVAGNPAATNSKNPFLFDTNGYYGVNTATSNTTKITIPHWAADTLYYYCNAHSGMGSSINVTTDIFKADPYAWKCTLALPCLGNANDVSYLINCNATELPIVPQANAHADFSTGNFYGGSYDLDGTGDYINVNSSSPYSHVNFGYGDYTAECWVYLDGTGDEYVFNMSTNNGGAAPHWNINFYSTNLIRAGRTDGSGNSRHQISYDFPRNKWMHIAISRGGFTSKLFLDGVLIDSRSDNDGIVPIGNLNIGAYNNGGAELNGFVQDARIYNGVAKYTESFVVGSTAPDVLPDSPSGITGRTNLTKITDGAVYLSGSPDELTLADSDDFNFGSGEFTVEAFVEGNFGGSRTGSVILNQSVGGASSDSAFYFGCGTDGTSLYLSTSGSSWTNYIECANSKITRSGWHHIVWQRRGDLLEIYIDGIKQAVTSGSNSGNAAITGSIYNSSRAIEIGPQNNSGYYAGHISNLRVIKGTALYTSNFTPPTETLTTTSQGATASEVKLLCCQSNTEPGGAAVAPSISGPNNGTQWSSKVTPGSEFRSGFPAGDAFNGVTKTSTNDCAAPEINKVSFVEFDFGSGIPFTTLQMQCDDNNEGTVKVNGVDITSQLPTGSLTNTTITGVTSPLKTLRLDAVNANASSVYLGSITIDGTMLVDPLTQSGSPSATNFNPFTDDINAIRGQETGYATLNPLLKGANTTLSNGNLTVSSSGTTFDGFATGTILIPKTGKWFVEFTAGSLPSSTYYGMYNTRTWNPNGFSGTGFFGLQVDTGNKFKSTGSGAYMPAVSVGDVVGVMYDADNNTIGFMKNGINYGVAFDSSDGIDYTDHHRVWWNTNGATSVAHTVNFGQKPFKFPPPDGFQPLNLSNVQPEKVIARPDQYVGVSLWTGNGTSQTISGLKHKPDLVWSKARSFGADHELYDSVRGTMKRLYSSLTSQEGTPSSGVNSFNADGFGVTGGGGVNNNTSTYVGWTWKAGGNKNTFNIDDVGYANASDVNMNVGALNSSAFLKGQIWSGLMSVASGSFDQAASLAFNGVLQTDPNRLRTSGNQVLVTMTLSTPVTVSSQIKVHAEPGYNSSCTVTVGGVTHTSSTGALHTFNVSGSLTQMTLQSTQSGGRTYMEGMEIDGKLLVDDNITANSPSIAATGCSVGTKQGFSIVKWTGDGSDANRTVPHGLLEAPSFIIVKPLTEARHWLIWHKDYNDDDAAALFTTAPPAGSRFGPQAPTSSVFGVYGGQGNRGTTDFIGYCWHDVPGLQKFGSYESNSGGVFVELGFKPAILVIKNIDDTLTNSQWNVVDTKRDTYNEMFNNLAWDRSNGEPAVSATTYGVDIFSNGFHIPSGNTGEAINNTNGGADTYIYMAWAEAPSINLYGAQSNAF